MLSYSLIYKFFNSEFQKRVSSTKIFVTRVRIIYWFKCTFIPDGNAASIILPHFLLLTDYRGAHISSENREENLNIRIWNIFENLIYRDNVLKQRERDYY